MDEYKKFARNYEGLNPKEEIFKQEQFFRELEHCFAKTGFKKIHYYGNHDFSEFSVATGNRLIAVAEK
jgi:hypothetical protein